MTPCVTTSGKWLIKWCIYTYLFTYDSYIQYMVQKCNNKKDRMFHWLRSELTIQSRLNSKGHDIITFCCYAYETMKYVTLCIYASPQQTVNTIFNADASPQHTVYTMVYTDASPQHTVYTMVYTDASPQHTVYTMVYVDASPQHTAYTMVYTDASPQHTA